MDAPLILTTKINPSEIDKEALNVDINNKYPLEFYELTMNYPNPKEALNAGIETVETVLGSAREMEGFGFTHGTNNCADGPKHNPYNTIDSMKVKMSKYGSITLDEILENVAFIELNVPVFVVQELMTHDRIKNSINIGNVGKKMNFWYPEDWIIEACKISIQFSCD